VNGHRVAAASHAVRQGDVVTIALEHAVRVLRVLDFSDRRGSADEARRLREVMDEPMGLPKNSPGGRT
jgi:ribosome-associated heat shock protein Hsp15